MPEPDGYLSRARAAYASGKFEEAGRILEAWKRADPEGFAAAHREREAHLAVHAPAESVTCLRCQKDVPRAGQWALFEGSTLIPAVLGDLFVGRRMLDVYPCPSCGHVEFFTPPETRSR